MFRLLRVAMFIALFTGITSNSILSHAQDFAPPESLKIVMNEMGENLKLVVDVLLKGRQVSEMQFKTAARALPGFAVRASKFLPPKLLDGSGQVRPGQEAMVKKYRELMTKMIAALSELDHAIATSDRTEAKNLLFKKIAPLQKEAHNLFKVTE